MIEQNSEFVVFIERNSKILISAQDIRKIRLWNQHLAGGHCNTPLELVKWMGALQAQDKSMVKWAIGIRLADAGLSFVDEALDKGDILRTHVLRPTWHLVPAKDIGWMIALTGPRIRSSMKSRLQQLELSPEILKLSIDLICKALDDSGHMSREGLMEHLRKHGILTDENRSSHILMNAELEGMICSGPNLSGKQTYALLAKRVPKRITLTKEESLYELARRYFSSHGPATLADFCWWSGLGTRDATIGINLNINGMIRETNGTNDYWFFEPQKPCFDLPPQVILLPAFDEFLISYKDRKEIIPVSIQRKAVSNNGIFYPIVLYNGEVIGTWTRKQGPRQLSINISYFSKPGLAVQEQVNLRAEEFGVFYGQNVKISHE
ncbi:MAG: AlkZ family DNA glycosylase [Bacteroidales bacterium]|nr:AlkZ family DNA glycosylase [Bacteroidales bacterium]